MSGSIRQESRGAGDYVKTEFQNKRSEGRDAICADRGGEGPDREAAERGGTASSGVRKSLGGRRRLGGPAAQHCGACIIPLPGPHSRFRVVPTESTGDVRV